MRQSTKPVSAARRAGERPARDGWSEVRVCGAPGNAGSANDVVFPNSTRSLRRARRVGGGTSVAAQHERIELPPYDGAAGLIANLVVSTATTTPTSRSSTYPTRSTAPTYCNGGDKLDFALVDTRGKRIVVYLQN